MSEFDINMIKYNQTQKFIELSYNNESLKLNFSSVYIPFGLEKYFDSYILKIASNDQSKELFDIIKSIEQRNVSYLKEQEVFSGCDYKSQIIHKKNYGDFLIVKIPSVKGQFTVDIMDNENKINNVFGIKKKQKIDICLELNTIWNFKNKYSCVPKVSKIKLL